MEAEGVKCGVMVMIALKTAIDKHEVTTMNVSPYGEWNTMESFYHLFYGDAHEEIYWLWK